MKFRIRKNSLLILVGIFLIFTPRTYADIALSEVILDFNESSELRKDIWVTNHGNSKSFVEISPYLILNPGEDPVQKEPVSDPRKSEIVVTPNKMILEPGQKKAIRVLLKKFSRKEEKIYRINVVPKVGNVKLKGRAKEGEIRTGVKVIVGYDVLTILRPDNPKKDYSLNISGKNLEVRNKGNVSILVDEVHQCKTSNLEECSIVKGPRVHPNKTESIKLSETKNLKVYIKYGERTEVKTL